jgi:hypothetical protein
MVHILGIVSVSMHVHEGFCEQLERATSPVSFTVPVACTVTWQEKREE